MLSAKEFVGPKKLVCQKLDPKKIWLWKQFASKRSIWARKDLVFKNLGSIKTIWSMKNLNILDQKK